MAKSPQELAVTISALTPEGLGIASLDGRELRVRNALPGEVVQARILRRRKGLVLADGVAVAQPHVDRIDSACGYFPRCGGCNLHHLRAHAQLVLKQGQLAGALAGQGVQPRQWAPPRSAGRLGYRRKARLGVRRVGDQVFVGFRESFSNRVARMQACAVLTPELSSLLGPLRSLIAQLSVADKIPQIELAQGDDHLALLVRHLEPFNDADLGLWESLQRQTGARIALQSGGYDTLQTLHGGPLQTLGYQIPEAGLYMRFLPQQFTQVNAAMNLMLIRHMLAYLYDLNGKKVADLFCGIGNLTLPLVRAGAQAWGYEAAEDAVAMARFNARLNGVEARVEFAAMDLYGTASGAAAGAQHLLPDDLDVLVLDPPRSGAGPNLPVWLAAFGGEEIIYVSCSPGSFAADAGQITAAGFELERVGVFDMFPHTAHVETMGYFRRARRPTAAGVHG